MLQHLHGLTLAVSPLVLPGYAPSAAAKCLEGQTACNGVCYDRSSEHDHGGGRRETRYLRIETPPMRRYQR